MKKFLYSILAFAAISFAGVSCVQEEPHQPGEPDVEGCYGVYFPAQTTNLNLDPAEALTATVSVVRANTAGAIEVPVILVDETGIFSISDLSFEDGQSESQIEIAFPGAEVGVKYECSLAIEDPLYASKYSSNPVNIDFSVVREKWNDLGKGTWIETGNGYFSPFEAPVTVLQNDNDRNIYRVRMKWEDDAVFTMDNDEYFEFKVLQPGDMVYDAKITLNDLVYFAVFNTGYINTSYDAPILYVHPGSFSNMGDESYFKQNKVLQYQDNGLPAGIQFAPYFYMDGIGGWDYTQDSDVVKLIFPGAVLTDYSLSIQTGLAEDGELPVLFTYGADVASAKYAVYEGRLNSAQKDKYATAIADGSETAAKTVPEGGLFSLSMEATGVYSIVGVTFDAAGNAQMSESAEFSYVAKGDTRPVVVSAGLSATNKYGSEGSTSDNTLEYFVYGKDIVDAKVALFMSKDFEADPEGCVNSLMSVASVDAAALELINGSFLDGTYRQRIPGTEYTLLVWATNGYEEKVVSAQAKTTGKVTVTVEEMLGTYAVSATSGFNGPYEEPEIWILAESDNAEKGNVMFTAIFSMDCSANPVYANVDTDKNTITIPSGQYIMSMPDYGYNLYFCSYNSADGSPAADDVVFDIMAAGEFTGPNVIFGPFVFNDANEPQGWWDAYVGTMASLMPDNAQASAPASMKMKALHSGIVRRNINHD